jgi:hypothetical protein
MYLLDFQADMLKGRNGTAILKDFAERKKD